MSLTKCKHLGRKKSLKLKSCKFLFLKINGLYHISLLNTNFLVVKLKSNIFLVYMIRDTMIDTQKKKKTKKKDESIFLPKNRKWYK